MKTKVIVTEDLGIPKDARIITRESNAVTYHENNINIVKVTPAFLQVVPFTSWCCGYTVDAFEIHTSDIRVEDVVYFITRVIESDVPLDPNALLSSNCGGTITFDHVTLRLPMYIDPVLFRNDLEYILDGDFDHLAYIEDFEVIL